MSDEHYYKIYMESISHIFNMNNMTDENIKLFTKLVWLFNIILTQSSSVKLIATKPFWLRNYPPIFILITGTSIALEIS